MPHNLPPNQFEPGSEAPFEPLIAPESVQDALVDVDGPASFMVRPERPVEVRTGKVGRPSVFTPERRDLILAALRAGNYVQTAITAAGVPRGTYYGWIRQGRLAAAKQDAGEQLSESEQEYLDFFEAIPQAEAEAEVRLVTMISKAAANDWRAAEKLLSRRWAGRWKEVTATEHTGADGMPLAVESGRIDDDGIKALARELEMRAIGAGREEPVDAEIIEDDDE